MNQNRFARYFSDDSRGVDRGVPALSGFITNPLSESVTPAQALMYQAAYQQALKDSEEPEWPMAECWN